MPKKYQGACRLIDAAVEVPEVLSLHLGKITVFRTHLRLQKKKLLMHLLGSDYQAIYDILARMPDNQSREKALAAAIHDRWCRRTFDRCMTLWGLVAEVDYRAGLVLEGGWAKPIGVDHSAVLLSSTELADFYVTHHQFSHSRPWTDAVGRENGKTKLMPMEYRDADFLELQTQLNFVICEIKKLIQDVREARNFVAKIVGNSRRN